MHLINISLISSILILGFGLSGCSGDTTEAAPATQSDPSTTGNSDPTTGDTTTPEVLTSSAGIYLAESNESTRTGYAFYTHPLYLDSKLYVRMYRGLDFGVEVGMKVLSYDLSGFNADRDMSTIPTEILYDQVGPAYTHARFNQRYYDIAEVDNALYFSTLPENEDTLSQSSYIKYDIASGSEVYHQRETPLIDEHFNTTFDLARGWFLPFSNNQYMGVVEEGIAKVFNTNDGSFYKEGVYDYLGGPSSGSSGDNLPPVGTENRFYGVSSSFYSISYLSNHVDYGYRDFTADPEYIVNDILADFLTKYTGSKTYTLANYNGDGSGAISPLVIDGNTIYLIATLAYDNSGGYRQRDLYLMEYDTNAQLQEIHLLGAQSGPGFSFDATHVYKYGSNLYFKFRSNNASEFCSYNLNSHTYNYKVNIGNHVGFADYPWTAYAITGSTVIIPEKVRPDNYDPNVFETTYVYDFVFKVINITDGTVIKTLHHKDMMGLVTNEGVYIKDVYVDANGVYFTGMKWTRTTHHNIIVKIDSSGNTVDFSRHRANAHYTGVITNR